MSELKPCPFCGGRAHLVVSEDDGGYRATVYCTSGAEIGCFTKMSHWALKKAWVIKSATEAWNRRAQPANDPLALEQLREMHGQPVWVVPNRGIAKWYLVDVANDCCSTCDMDVVDFELYGPKDKSYGWLAYRRPPERSEDDAKV